VAYKTDERTVRRNYATVAKGFLIAAMKHRLLFKFVPDRIPIRIVESYDTMILPNQNDINSTLYPKS
jgi:hypothetical protein